MPFELVVFGGYYLVASCSARASWPRRRSSWPWSRSCGPWCGRGFEGKERPRESDRRPADGSTLRRRMERINAATRGCGRSARPAAASSGRSQRVAAIGHDTPSAVGQGASRSAPLDPTVGPPVALMPEAGTLRPGSEGPQVASSARRHHRQTWVTQFSAGALGDLTRTTRRTLGRGMLSDHTACTAEMPAGPVHALERSAGHVPADALAGHREGRLVLKRAEVLASEPRVADLVPAALADKVPAVTACPPDGRPAASVENPAEASRRPGFCVIPPRSPTCAGD